jgi:hypothetical protein
MYCQTRTIPFMSRFGLAARAHRCSGKPAFNANMTLKVFQAIHTRDELRRLYFRMIGDRQGDERGNSIKARINRTPELRSRQRPEGRRKRSMATRLRCVSRTNSHFTSA